MNNSAVPTNWQASTFLNPTIQTYADLAFRVKTHFGWPISVIELTDEQIANFIDDAVERFTQYAGYDEEYLIFCDNLYIPGCGVKLDELTPVACNLQQCVLTSEEVYTIVTELPEEDLGTYSGLLSVTPFHYVSTYDKCDPADIKVVEASGQTIEIKFKANAPWDFSKTCRANCIRIFPKSFNCGTLTSLFHDMVFDLEAFITENEEYAGWINELSSSPFELDAFPISAMECHILSVIPGSSFSLEEFYLPNVLVGDETTACINIKDGKGFIYPTCDVASLSTCSPLSSIWANNDISLESATHFSSPTIPVCMGSSIPLDSFNGMIGTFTLCNTAINTFGPFELQGVQFEIDVKPSEDILFDRICDIRNGGFVLKKIIQDHSQCLNSTPDWTEIDVQFLYVGTEETTATRVVETSSFYDDSLVSRRKIHGVFSAEPGNEMGYGGFGGNNLLFNFDYSLMSNVFGYDLQGNRHAFYKNGYDLVTYHAARAFMETTRKMLRYVSYSYNPDTQLLKLIPEPRQSKFENVYVDNSTNRECYLVGCYVEKPVEYVLKQTWIRDWVVASMMETMGLIRSQYGQVTLYGGATVSGESLVTMGQSQKEKLLDQLRKENYFSAPPMFFLG